MRFRFAPPHNLRYRCQSHRERTGSGTTDITQIDEDALVQRTSAGYRFIASPARFSATRNGQPLEDALQQIAMSMITTYEVDQNGRLVDMSSTDVTQKLQDLVPEPLRPMAAHMFSKEALFAKNKAEWDGRYADLAGRELQWGSSFDWTSEFISPNGVSATCWGTTALIEELECAGRKCCRLRYAYGSNPEGVRAITERLINAMDIRATLSPWELAGEGERVVEADTMLIHSERLWRTADMALMMPGIGRGISRFEESRTWAYTYERPATR